MSMNWRIRFYSSKLEDELQELPAGLLARLLRYAERMEHFGPDLGMPHTRAMGEGLFELRLKAVEGIGRVFYCTVVNRQIVFLHQFVKKSQRTPTKELALARKRMKEIMYGSNG
jgi:phage-related protein